MMQTASKFRFKVSKPLPPQPPPNLPGVACILGLPSLDTHLDDTAMEKAAKKCRAETKHSPLVLAGPSTVVEAPDASRSSTAHEMKVLDRTEELWNVASDTAVHGRVETGFRTASARHQPHESFQPPVLQLQIVDDVEQLQLSSGTSLNAAMPVEVQTGFRLPASCYYRQPVAAMQPANAQGCVPSVSPPEHVISAQSTSHPSISAAPNQQAEEVDGGHLASSCLETGFRSSTPPSFDDASLLLTSAHRMRQSHCECGRTLRGSRCAVPTAS